MTDAAITVDGGEFVNGSYIEDPNYIAPAENVAAYEYPRKRNGAAISVGGRLEIATKGQTVLDNSYGLIQSDGHSDLSSERQILNVSGIIASNGGGGLSAPEIIVRREEILQKPYGAKTCPGHYYRKRGSLVTDSCSGGGRCTTTYHFREQSDEGWINIGGGDLEIDTDSLVVRASHIVAKDRLFLKRQSIDLPKSEDGELKGIPGIFVESHQDQQLVSGMAQMQGESYRHEISNFPAIHKAGIFSHSDMKLESHGLRIEGMTTAQTLDVVTALTQTVRRAGFNVSTDQARDLLIDLVSGAQHEANQPHSLMTHHKGQFVYDLPFERRENPAYGRGPVPVLTDDYDVFEQMMRPGIPSMYLQHTVSKMVLENLLDTLVLKVLRNPQSNDFSRKLYMQAQHFAIKNMERRLLKNKEAATDEEAGILVEARYHEIIPITYEDMSNYAKDMKACAKEMLLFDLRANYQSLEKLKSMERDLDHEIKGLRPAVFIPKETVKKETSSAAMRSDGALDHHIRGNMVMKGATKYSSYGGTTEIDGDLIAEAIAMRQGSVDNFSEQSARPILRNAGEHNEQNYLIEGNATLIGAQIDTGGEGNVMNMRVKGFVQELALALSNKKTSHRRTKKEDITTITTHIHMDPVQQVGEGTRNLESLSSMYQQAPVIEEKTTLNIVAPQHVMDDVHDETTTQIITERRGGKNIAGIARSSKTIQEWMRSSISKGAIIKGTLNVSTNKARYVNPINSLRVLKIFRLFFLVAFFTF